MKFTVCLYQDVTVHFIADKYSMFYLNFGHMFVTREMYLVWA